MSESMNLVDQMMTEWKNTKSFICGSLHCEKTFVSSYRF